MGPLRIRRAGDPPQEQRKQRAEGYALYEEKPNLRRKGKCVAALHRPVQARTLVLRGGLSGYNV